MSGSLGGGQTLSLKAWHPLLLAKGQLLGHPAGEDKKVAGAVNTNSSLFPGGKPSAWGEGGGRAEGMLGQFTLGLSCSGHFR